jgi:tetratricopeptide (TPR) repeat protein
VPLSLPAVIAIVLIALGAAPQTRGPQARSEQTRVAQAPKIAPASGRSVYLDILERYRRGDQGAAVKALHELPDGHSANFVFGELERMTDRGSEMGNRAAESEFRQQRLADGWRVAFPVAAAIHLEAGYSLMELGQSGRGSDHFEVARLLVDYPRFEQVMEGRPEVLGRHAQLRRDIYFGILWTLQAERPLALLEEHLVRMRKPFAADADLALAQGSLEEYWSSNLVIRTTRAPTTTQAANGWRRATQAMRLKNAEDRFRIALKIDPQLAEARMRLGRVLQQRGKLREAHAELEAVLNQPDAPAVVRYLASMFLVDVLEAEGQTAAAYTRVRELVTRFPDCQSVRLAMSRVYEARGDRASALRALEPLWKEHGQRKCSDPWWSYQLGQLWRMPFLIEQLRADAREAR